MSAEKVLLLALCAAADIAREGGFGGQPGFAENREQAMQNQSQTSNEPEIALLGEHHPLIQQLGSTEGLHELTHVSRSLRLPPVRNVETLRRFVRAYQTKILIPLELPIIHRAYLHGSSNRTQELIELDNQIAASRNLRDFANASRRVGQAQLRRLRPLRDVRVLQRYLAAVDAKEASGWHTLVFGLTLAIYSVPLRQGLLGYAQQVMNGFMQSAGMRFPVSASEIDQIVTELNAALPTALGTLLLLEGLEKSRRPRA